MVLVAKAKGGVNINWQDIKTEYIEGSLSQKELAKKHGIPFGTFQKKAKAENWYLLKKENSKQIRESRANDENSFEKKEETSECKNTFHRALGFENLYSLGNMLADKFALAVEQLGSDGEEIDTNRLKQLVGVMKDLTGIAENEENASDKPEEKQKEFVDIIKLALGVCEKDINNDAELISSKEEADVAI